MELWPGIIFEPTDEEIVSFLKSAAEGSQIPKEAAKCIYSVDLYGDKPPWEIFANEFPDKRVFYVLTTLKTTSEHRLKRTAGVGTWKGPNARTKLPLGEKYGMTYSIEDAKSNIKKKTTHWNMTEYRLFNYNSYKTSSSSEGEYAFCRVVYSKKYVQPEYLPLQRPCVDNVYNACQPEVGIRMPDIYNSSSVTTCTSLGGGQVASQYFNPNQNICYGNSFTSAYNIAEGQEVQQQQSAAPSTANIEDTDIYKELSAMVNGYNATRGEESSGVNNSEVFGSMEVTENFYGATATNTCNGLMSEEQPVIYSDGQPNAEDLPWSASAASNGEQQSVNYNDVSIYDLIDFSNDEFLPDQISYMEAVENVCSASATPNTCNGLVLEQQPVIDSEDQPNANVWPVYNAEVYTSTSTRTNTAPVLGVSAAAVEEEQEVGNNQKATDHVNNNSWNIEDFLPGQLTDVEEEDSDSEEDDHTFASFLESHLEEAEEEVAVPHSREAATKGFEISSPQQNANTM